MVSYSALAPVTADQYGNDCCNFYIPCLDFDVEKTKASFPRALRSAMRCVASGSESPLVPASTLTRRATQRNATHRAVRVETTTVYLAAVILSLDVVTLQSYTASIPSL